ncbi:MAG: LysE family translocator [Hyphomicrobiales bacterium]|nr:LysE family translocator [Hyphomicrobiales bacterium]MDE2017137.1 LysE family translocator [Hyphomicrobiales bacterium]
MQTTLAALTTFAFATSITPGPNNLMLMMSGASFGLRRTLPHWLGVSVGFGAMIFALGAGLSGLLDAAPRARLALKIVGAAYMIWLAWRIANAGRSAGRAAAARPMTFVEAGAFQWANPKAWAMALTTVGVYAGAGTLREVALAACVAGLVNFPCVGVWAAAGRPLRVFAEEDKRRTLIHRGLALLVLLSLAPLVWGGA